MAEQRAAPMTRERFLSWLTFEHLLTLATAILMVGVAYGRLTADLDRMSQDISAQIELANERQKGAVELLRSEMMARTEANRAGIAATRDSLQVELRAIREGIEDVRRRLDRAENGERRGALDMPPPEGPL